MDGIENFPITNLTFFEDLRAQGGNDFISRLQLQLSESAASTRFATMRRVARTFRIAKLTR